jgi:hypothetical protein
MVMPDLIRCFQIEFCSPLRSGGSDPDGDITQERVRRVVLFIYRSHDVEQALARTAISFLMIRRPKAH